MLKTPPLQTATATIDTLCGRLQSASLLEDRRAAILGLRSFAKQYPASVASGSLRELISTLRRDGLGEEGQSGAGRKSEEGTGDVDTIRLVLETLLMLFNPDSESPEAGDEIAFFMADEFSMRQDNISLLLNLLDPTSPYADYYSRLYSVQLLSSVCAARAERLQECVLSAPLGVSRLVGVLDDGRDAVRNAGLLLLVDLTSGATEDLRKIVAFEDVFAKVFGLVQLEGGLAEAGITAQDCLSLLANLIKGSASNQTMFRESGCVAQLAQLLRQAFPPSETEAPFIIQSREKSTFGLLQLVRLFLSPGESSTPQNQTALFRAGTAQVLIELGFESGLPSPIRTSALKCGADLILNNQPLQEAFAALTIAVPAASSDGASTPGSRVNGTRSAGPSNKGSARPSADRPRTYIIEALLNLSLDSPLEDNSLRAAACQLIQAYMAGHDRIRAHFLQRAISGHAQHEKASNVLMTLAQPGTDVTALIFASWTVQELVSDNPEAKAALANVKEGDESEGEDVVSFIQSLGSLLQGALQQSADERVIAAYASLLVIFLWDFLPGVDDLLAEGSSLIQSLASVPKSPTVDPLVAGLGTALLGTVYEFSTKDSPISRRTLAPILTHKLGRSTYLEALVQLRRQPTVRDFDVGEEMDVEAILGRTFVDLFMVEYSRLRKAIDKDPGVEVLHRSAAEAGVDRDVLDDLRQQVQTSKDALAQTQEDALATNQKHDQERLAVSKDLQTASAEVERLRRINQSMQQEHERDAKSAENKRAKEKEEAIAERQRSIAAAEKESQQKVQKATQDSETASKGKLEELERRIAEVGNTLRTEQSGHSSAREQLEKVTSQHTDLIAREKKVSEQFAELMQRHGKLGKEHQQLQTTSAQISEDLAAATKESESRAAELEVLRSQLKDLQDDVKAKEEELRTERAGFAELEKELDALKTSSGKDAKKAEEASRAKEEVEKIKKEAEKTKQETDKMKKEIEKLKKEAETSKKEAENLKKEAAKDKKEANKPGKKDAGGSSKETEKLRKEAEGLRVELKETKDSEKGAREELESMLLVMGDIEAKRDGYRKKVKEMGGQVTEDEDDDEDDEDDEDSDREVD